MPILISLMISRRMFLIMTICKVAINKVGRECHKCQK